MPKEKDFYTIKEIATELSIGYESVRRMIGRGDIPVHHFSGKALRVSKEDFKKFKEKSRIINEK